MEDGLETQEAEDKPEDSVNPGMICLRAWLNVLSMGPMEDPSVLWKWEMEEYQSVGGGKCSLQRLGNQEEKLGKAVDGWQSDQPSWAQCEKEPQNHTVKNHLIFHIW